MDEDAEGEIFKGGNSRGGLGRVVLAHDVDEAWGCCGGEGGLKNLSTGEFGHGFFLPWNMVGVSCS